MNTGILLTLWFITGQLFGISFAKYTRAKKQTKIITSIMIFVSLTLTYMYYTQ